MPSNRPLIVGGSAIALLTLAGVAAAQSPGAGSELGFGTRIGIRFAVALVVNLLLGGAAVALGPRYTAKRIGEIRSDPGAAFVWGLLVSIGVPIALALLAITIIGLVVAIPSILLLAAIGIAGSAIAVVWIGSTLVGDGDRPDGKAAVVGALVLAVAAAIPVLGNLLTSIVSLFGTGVVGRGLYESWR